MFAISLRIFIKQNTTFCVLRALYTVCIYKTSRSIQAPETNIEIPALLHIEYCTHSLSNSYLLAPFNEIHSTRLHILAASFRIAFHSDAILSVPFRNAIFRRIIIATLRCCFAQLLKVVHFVSDRCFFAPLYGKLSGIVET
jgi:hypothetical protein